jgi:phosphohistidine phosphatase
MNLYLVRHADAVPVGAEGIHQDEQRPLSATGKEQVELLAAAFRRLHFPPCQVLSSPLVRARQTAEQLLEHWAIPGLVLSECEALLPGGSSRRLAKFLRQLDTPNVVLVGHEPDLGRHTAWLIGSKRARIEFAKGGAAAVVCDHPPRKGEGTLLWLLTPTWLDAGPS